MAITALAFLLAGCNGGAHPQPQSDGGVKDMSSAPLDGSTIADLSVGINDAADAAVATADAAKSADLDGGSEIGDMATAQPAPASLCSSGCSAGTRSCNGLCVASGDWHYGCGPATGCQPCAMAHATPACSGTSCAIGSCEPGWADCNGDPTDGCEADLSRPATCTSCSTKCSGATGLCTPSGCASSCAIGLTLCTDRCVDVATSAKNCGGCGQDCSAAQAFGTCSGGNCGFTCWPGYTSCSGTCTDKTRDPNNCGTCSNKCPQVTDAVALCTGSLCGATCQPGWTVCTGACVTLQTDPSNCGSCGHACASGDACMAGVCGVPAVLAGNLSLQRMALDTASVYWTDSSEVDSVPIGGGSVAHLYTGQSGPTGIAVDSTYVYWSNRLGGAIWRALKDGTGSPQLVSSATTPTDIGLHGANVYWIDQSSDVSMAPATGGASSVALALGFGQNAMLLTAPNDLYVASTANPSGGEGVHSVLGRAGDNALAAFDANPYLAQDGTNVYFNDGQADVSPGIKWFDQVSGQKGARALPAFSLPRPVAASSCGVFFTDTGGLYVLQPGMAFPAIVLANASGRVLVDASQLYVALSGQTLIRLPLP